MDYLDEAKEYWLAWLDMFGEFVPFEVWLEKQQDIADQYLIDSYDLT